MTLRAKHHKHQHNLWWVNVNHILFSLVAGQLWCMGIPMNFTKLVGTFNLGVVISGEIEAALKQELLMG